MPAPRQRMTQGEVTVHGGVYVPYGPLLSFPPPFVCRDGDLVGFVLHVEDKALLDASIEETLNNTTRGLKYEALVPFVVMMVGRFNRQESVGTGYVGKGWASESSVAFWLPLRRSDGDSTFRLTAPYVIVDNPMSLVCGREDFGFAKGEARFDPADRMADEVGINAFGGKWGGEATWTKLLKVRKEGLLDGVLTAAVENETVEDMATELAARRKNEIPEDAIRPDDLLGGIGDTLEAIKMVITAMFTKEARQVFLKQIRDAQAPTQCAYEKIIEAPLKFSNPMPRGLQRWSYKITPVDTYPIVEKLGIKSEDTVTAFRIATEMTLGGAVLQMDDAGVDEQVPTPAGPN